MNKSAFMFSKLLILVFFLLTPLISFGSEPEDVALKDAVVKNNLVGAEQVISADQTIQSYNNDIEITIQNDGEQIVVDATFTVPVKPQLVWETLTDFDSIQNFISSVQSSKIINRTENTLYVSQDSIIKIGFFTFSFESTRQINLFPFWKIRERMIKGNMRKMEETTQLLLEGDQTRITYHANIVPDMWVQKFIGQVFIEDEARKQFQEIIDEILRRERKRVSYQQGNNVLDASTVRPLSLSR
jgi:carbon monoxide dehydrogenase subunit G